MKLDEEDKNWILSELERERRTTIVCSLYHKGMTNQDDETRVGTSCVLDELAVIDSHLFVQLYERGKSDPNPMVRSHLTGFDIYARICQEEKSFGPSDFDMPPVKRAYASNLEAKVFDATITTNLAKELIESVPSGVEYFTKLLSIQKPKPEQHSAEKESPVFCLNESHLTEFLRICNERIGKQYVPPQFELFRAQSYALEVVPFLPLIALIDIDEFICIHKDGITNSDFLVRKDTARGIAKFAELLDQDFYPLRGNPSGDFFFEFLDSDYVSEWLVSNDPWEGVDILGVTDRLRKLAQNPHQDYRKLKEIIDFNKVKDFNELVDCSSINTRYHVVNRLGRGAAGSTYLVYSDELKAYNALKVIPPDKVNPKEAELMAKLNGHDLENIVQIHDAGNHLVTINGKTVYAIVMEYVEGPSLDKLIPTILSPDEVLGYGAQILNGINRLRRYGITHRDLTPENIKLSAFGTRLKILDFGIATDEEKPNAKDNRRFGPPGEAPADDLFSLGCMMYKMITGEHIILNSQEESTLSSYADKMAEIKSKLYSEDRLSGICQLRIGEISKNSKERYSKWFDGLEFYVDFSEEQWRKGVAEVGEIILLCLGGDIDSVIKKYHSLGGMYKFYLMSKWEIISQFRDLSMKNEEEIRS